MFSLYPSLFWELKDKGNSNNFQFWPENLGSMLEYWYIEHDLLVVVLRFSRVSCTLLRLVQNQINLLESNPNVHGFLSYTVLKKDGWINFKSTVQIPGSSHFQILWRGDHFRSGIICGTIWGSFPVLSDHLRYNLGIICGPVHLYTFYFFKLLALR